MRLSEMLGVAICGLSLLLGQPTRAEILTLDTASGRQTIRLDTVSIPRSRNSASSRSKFAYYLGNERLEAEADCQRKVWTVEGQEYKPQSETTRNMLSIVCSARYAEPMEDTSNVLVFDPPSRVRSSPGGSVKCTLNKMVVISVNVEPDDGWYSTSACDGGWIHSSQVRPFD
jgi:hypothetical protein